MNPTNILWIDRWTKQLGFAYTKQNIVLPVWVLPNNGDLYFSIAGMVAQHQISQIVIGYPKGNTKWADAVDRLVKSIKVMLPEWCSVDTVDEHYTTVMAQAITGDYGKQKWFDDCLAAMEIVRRYQKKLRGE